MQQNRTQIWLAARDAHPNGCLSLSISPAKLSAYPRYRTICGCSTVRVIIILAARWSLSFIMKQHKAQLSGRRRCRGARFAGCAAHSAGLGDERQRAGCSWLDEASLRLKSAQRNAQSRPLRKSRLISGGGLFSLRLCVSVWGLRTRPYVYLLRPPASAQNRPLRAFGVQQLNR